MVMNIQIKITDAEWEVMRVVWAHGSVTSREIIENLESKMQWKAPTIKTLIGRLVEKGALATSLEGRKFIYTAKVSEYESMDVYTEDILSRVCNKHNGKVIADLVEEAALSKKDIASLMELLQKKSESALEVVPCECVTGQCGCHLHHS